MAVQASRSRAFFLELVLDIAIFAVCAAVALQVFVHAKLTSDDSQALSHMVVQAQNAAECFKAADGDLQALAAALGGELADSEITCYYNSEFQQVSDDQAPYRLTCDFASEGALATLAISASHEGEQIYALSATDLLPAAAAPVAAAASQATEAQEAPEAPAVGTAVLEEIDIAPVPEDQLQGAR